MASIRHVIIAIAMLASGSSAMAAGWSLYQNGRFAYSIDIPPGFTAIQEADNGDGGIATSDSGNAELRVWGSYLTDTDFKAEILSRIQSDVQDGWAVSYQRQTADTASWSGSKGTRIVYARAIAACDGAAAYFQLEYDRSALKSYDPVIKRLVKSLAKAC